MKLTERGTTEVVPRFAFRDAPYTVDASGKAQFIQLRVCRRLARCEGAATELQPR